jgi:hypothetical protein
LLFDLFLGARAEILTKISLVFWSILRQQKDISKIIDLYIVRQFMVQNIMFMKSLTIFLLFLLQQACRFDRSVNPISTRGGGHIIPTQYTEVRFASFLSGGFTTMAGRS